LQNQHGRSAVVIHGCAINLILTPDVLEPLGDSLVMRGNPSRNCIQCTLFVELNRFTAFDTHGASYESLNSMASLPPVEDIRAFRASISFVRACTILRTSASSYSYADLFPNLESTRIDLIAFIVRRSANWTNFLSFSVARFCSNIFYILNEENLRVFF